MANGQSGEYLPDDLSPSSIARLSTWFGANDSQSPYGSVPSPTASNFDRQSLAIRGQNPSRLQQRHPSGLGVNTRGSPSPDQEQSEVLAASPTSMRGAGAAQHAGSPIMGQFPAPPSAGSRSGPPSPNLRAGQYSPSSPGNSPDPSDPFLPQRRPSTDPLQQSMNSQFGQSTTSLPVYEDDRAPNPYHDNDSAGSPNLLLNGQNVQRHPYSTAGLHARNSSQGQHGGEKHVSYPNEKAGLGVYYDNAAPASNRYSSGPWGNTVRPPSGVKGGKKSIKQKWAGLSGLKKGGIIGGIILLIAAIVAAIIVALKLTSANSTSTKAANGAAAADAGSSSSSTGRGASRTSSAAPTSTTGGFQGEQTGGTGTTVYMTNGTSFTYTNAFGGTWDAVPFSNRARAQADVPPLNEQWDYSNNLIAGVNVGGWLTLEPFISPALYEPYMNAAVPAIDEWTLSQNLGANMATTLTNHYDTFITERDFADIAAAGLNWVRLPIPFWAIEVYDNEPFLANVAWDYVLMAFEWARKYGLRINLDLHAVPGSQNGWNHSGKYGMVNFLNGVMGIANAQRTLNIIRTLSEFISQPQYSPVVPMFGIINEAFMATIGQPNMQAFYFQAYNIVREASGVGAGNGPMISLHDGFTNQASWYGFLEGADRLALDRHPYLCFAAPNNNPLPEQALTPCQQWAAGYNETGANYAFNMAGEYSLAINDCGRFLNGVNQGQRFEGTYPNATTPDYAAVGSCAEWNDYTTWDATRKQGLINVALAQMDSVRNAFFWTWKTGITTTTGLVANPLWSYSNGLREGYMPLNPRSSLGFCQAYVAEQGAAAMPTYAWNGILAPSATGAGPGVLAAAQTAAYGAWPPTSLPGIPVATALPVYTATAPVITMTASTPTNYPAGVPTAAVGNGWNNAADNSGWYTPIAGCTYPDQWNAVGAEVPAARCTGA